MGHENAEGMAHVGVRVEPTVRLGREVEGGRRAEIRPGLVRTDKVCHGVALS